MFGGQSSSDNQPQAVSLLKDKDSKSGGCVLIGFFSIFFFAGLAIGYYLILGAFMDYMNSDSWVETPCEVISSRVVESHDDDGTTYRPEIVYKYTYQGKNYESKRYDFFEVSSSGRSSKQKVVRDHPPGKKTVCYVDPTDPQKAVINRDFSWSILIVLLPLIFMAVGGGGIYWGIVTLTRTPAAATTDIAEWAPDSIKSELMSGDDPVPHGQHSGPVVLKPDSTALGTTGCMLFLALFWNGIVSIFVISVASDWMAGKGEWFTTLFLIPFVLVGLGLIAAFFYYLLASFNPKPVMTISDATIPLGTTVDLEWHFVGSTNSIRHLKIELVGEESATYRRGTDTHTDTEEFHREFIFETYESFEMSNGKAEVSLPHDSIHSFDGGNNEIVWKIEVKGDIPMWPDIQQAYPIFVLPHQEYEEQAS